MVTVLLFCAVSHNRSGDVPLRPKEMVTLLEEGRKQYNLVQARTTMPSFGSCWKDAVARLHFGCQNLDDGVQSDVALGFANCFLEGAGLPRHDCEDQDRPRETCLKTISDKAFIAYTEFFTHTHSMCFFIMSQLWHEETEKTIDKLSTSAADVAKQLQASEELQEELLIHQRKSVVIQQELLQNGVSLGSMLHESKNSLDLIFSEFRASTLEQQRLLSLVFQHLSTLQSWIVGEVSWVDSIAFYIPSFAFVYFLTSAQRTGNARIPGLIVLMLAGLMERFVSHILLSDGADPTYFEPVDIVNERLRWWVWLIRRCAIAADLLILAVTLYHYRNREEVMHHLLEEIKGQNEELLNYLHGKATNSNGLAQSTNLNKRDEADGLGYMPVLTSSSSSLSSPSTPPIHPSPSTSLLRGIRRSVQTINGMDSVAIPTAFSAFKPIKEQSSPGLQEHDQSLEVPPEESASSSVHQSTPKTKRKKRTPVALDSPGSSRYSLRRLRTPISS